MSVQIMANRHGTQAVMFDNTKDWSLGPVATDCEGCGLDAEGVLVAFQEYADNEREVRDVRVLSYPDLYDLWKDYMTDHHSHETSRPSRCERCGGTDLEPSTLRGWRCNSCSFWNGPTDS